ncbi:MAG: hypothetical protein ACTSP4_00670 [Candidatus Hodarchaeales archaeon]
MSTSQVDICNNGLDIIREANISSLDGNSLQAKKCNQHYDRVRKTILTENIWNFSTKEVSLAKEDGFEGEGKYVCKFNLPSDCLRLINIGGYDAEDCPNTYNVKDTYILSVSTADTLKVVYIRDVTETHLMPIWFTNYFSSSLAVEINMPINSDGKRLEVAMIIARKNKMRAFKNNGISKPNSVLNPGHLIRKRFYY